MSLKILYSRLSQTERIATNRNFNGLHLINIGSNCTYQTVYTWLVKLWHALSWEHSMYLICPSEIQKSQYIVGLYYWHLSVLVDLYRDVQRIRSDPGDHIEIFWWFKIMLFSLRCSQGCGLCWKNALRNFSIYWIKYSCEDFPYKFLLRFVTDVTNICDNSILSSIGRQALLRVTYILYTKW